MKQSPSDPHTEMSLLSLAPPVHSNPQMRAIRARLADKKKAQAINAEEQPRFFKETANSVGAGYKPGP